MTGFELMLFIAANKLNICECVSDTECACMLFVAAFFSLCLEVSGTDAKNSKNKTDERQQKMLSNRRK